MRLQQLSDTRFYMDVAHEYQKSNTVTFTLDYRPTWNHKYRTLNLHKHVILVVVKFRQNIPIIMKMFSKLWYRLVGEVNSGVDLFKPTHTHIFVLIGFVNVIKPQAYVASCKQSGHQNTNPNVF